MQVLAKNSRLSAFVKEIILLQSDEVGTHDLPFYADGYPGILYTAASGLRLLPMDKALPPFFLYGQTIEPIALQVEGAYKMIVFQLYPFATRILINVDPKSINDACYDLHQIPNAKTEATLSKLQTCETEGQVQIISQYLLSLVKLSSGDIDSSIKMAVSTIINTGGKISIKDLREQLFITERTFERRFAKEIGVSPKQFVRIIQFSFSLQQIEASDYTKLTNIAFDNGYSDQSHFIKTFKKYTGATPRELLTRLESD